MPAPGEHHPAFEEYCECIFELREDNVEVIQARVKAMHKEFARRRREVKNFAETCEIIGIAWIGEGAEPDGLMAALDEINTRFGRGKARLGLAHKGGEWRMRQENLSPSFTTRWGDIPAAKMG